MAKPWLGLILIIGVFGCGQRGPELHPVSGKVLDGDGKPAVNALVMFHPVGPGSALKNPPLGRVDEKGEFHLTTFQKDDGAPAGEYIVTVEWRPAKKAPFDPEPQDRLAGRYRDPAISKLRATVGHGPTLLEPFRVK